jgi:hypothetical protein
MMGRKWLAGAGVLAGFLALPAPVQAWNTVVWGGSVYEYVETYMKWDDAKLSAASMSYLGYPGRLATITSAEEQAAIESLIPSDWSYNAMLGGSDAKQEGTWVWETGPEAGTIFWKDGAPYNGAYTHWRPGEPNAFSPSEDYLILYQHQWTDSPANDYYHHGYIVEYQLETHGFDFAMTENHMLAVQNISPSARLVSLDITLPGDTFIDSAATAPGLDYARWSVVNASPGAGYVIPDSAFTDGKQSVTLALDLDPTEAVLFDVDFDSLSGQDGSGMALGTKLLARFILGDIEYVISGEVQAGDKTILGTAFPYSVRAIQTAPVPEPANAFLFVAGLCLLILFARNQAGKRAMHAKR